MTKQKKITDVAINMDSVLKALLFATLRTLSVGDQVDALAMAGWSHQQIGEATGLTANAVQKRRQNKKTKEE